MSDEYKELLEAFTEPLYLRKRKIPYVLFGMKRQDYDANGKMREVPDLHCLDCSSSSGQTAIIDQYLGKGYKILKYWFPLNESPQQVPKGAIAVDVDERLGTGEYAVLARYCQEKIDFDPREMKKLKEETSLLRKRLEEEMVKNAEAERKAGAGSGKGFKGKAEGEARE